jgi:hypothetical protein
LIISPEWLHYYLPLPPTSPNTKVFSRHGFSSYAPSNHNSPPFTDPNPQISAVSIANSVQAYITLTYTARVYSENPSLKATSKKSDEKAPASAHPSSTVTPVAARIFGTWTLVQSIVRLYAAYYVSNPQIYQMAYCTYAVAFGHFMAEWLVFGTVKWGAPLAGPVVISTSTLVWMWLQWDFYVQ